MICNQIEKRQNSQKMPSCYFSVLPKKDLVTACNILTQRRCQSAFLWVIEENTPFAFYLNLYISSFTLDVYISCAAQLGDNARGCSRNYKWEKYTSLQRNLKYLKADATIFNRYKRNE